MTTIQTTIFVDTEELQKMISDSVMNALLEYLPKKVIEKYNDMPDLMTTNQVAEFLQVSRVTLHEWKHKGFLVPRAMSGRRPRYLKEDVVNMNKK